MLSLNLLPIINLNLENIPESGRFLIFELRNEKEKVNIIRIISDEYDVLTIYNNLAKEISDFFVINTKEAEDYMFSKGGGQIKKVLNKIKIENNSRTLRENEILEVLKGVGCEICII